MAWSVFKDTLWHSRISTLLWGLGLGFIMAVTVLATPSFASMEMAELLQAFPSWMMNFLGVSDIDIIATPNGLIALGFYGKLALFIVAYPVAMGLRVTAQEESEGMMDLVLSQPVPRSRVVIEKFLAYSLTILIVMGMVILSIFLGSMGLTLPEGSPAVDIDKLALVTISIIPVLIFLLGLTAFVGTLVRRYRTTMAIVTAYIIASFVFQIVGPMVEIDWLDTISNFFVFNYFGVENTLKNGLSLYNLGVMLVLAVIFLAGSIYNFERRDIAV